ncbi:MAG: bifunctional ADP-heptose synthase [Flavobacteriales bacterium]|nr:bifunctional ADP-heptose synthase [Flavobacteriales bacterium]
MSAHTAELREIIKKFEGIQVLVLGDVMLDEYWHGAVHRISPEAPVPVVEVDRFEVMPGGAANVALNLRALGAEVGLAGLCGVDAPASQLRQLVADKGIKDFLMPVRDRPTTTKTRIMGNGVQILRLDRENNQPASEELKENILGHVRTVLRALPWQAFIFQDYDKGFLFTEVIQWVINFAIENEIPVVADPKRRNFWCYENVTLFKPNLRELAEALGHSANGLEGQARLLEGVRFLHQKMPHTFTLVTAGARGVYLRMGQDFMHFPARPRYVRDVSGAGDTVAAVAALGLATGAPPEAVAVLCNMAGGRVCEAPGVSVITAQDLLEETASHLPPSTILKLL